MLRALDDIPTRAVKFEPVRGSQAGNEILIRVGVSASKLVIKVNHGRDDAQFVPHLQNEP